MKPIHTLLFLVVILTGCVATKEDTKVDELPMYVGIEKSKDYKHTEADLQFISSQVTDHIMYKDKAARVWVNKGFAAYHDNKLHDAMRLFNKAWLIDKDNPDLYWGYSLVLRKQNQFCDAKKTADIALSKGRIKAKFLIETAFVYSACAMEDASLTTQQKADYISHSDELFRKAYSRKELSKEQVLSEWIKALSVRGDDIAAMEKLLLYVELTGHTLKGNTLEYLTDKSGSIMGFTPFDAPSGYGIGSIIDYGYTGMKHQLMFDPNYILSNALPNQKAILGNHLRAQRKKWTRSYNDKEKKKLLNTIKQHLIDNSRQLSAKARGAIHKIVDIEVSTTQAEHLIASDHNNLQYDMIQALPPSGGLTKGIRHNIDGAKQALIIIGIDVFKKAHITLHFDNSVTQDEKFEILDNVHFETVGLRMGATGNITINYDTPVIVGFRAVRFDNTALHHYTKEGKLP